MSPSPEVPKRAYLIASGLPTVEIFVIDGENNVVARGVETLSAELVPGIYKIRYRIGDKVTDSLEEFPPGEGTYYVPVPELQLPSPVPLSTPATGLQPASAQDAVAWSNSVQISAGKGSRIFVFISGGTNDSPAKLGELTLRTFEGNQVASLKDAPTKNGCQGCTVELDPGSYQLRLSSPGLPEIEQTVFAAAEWQTQVFIPVVPAAAGRCLDLSQSAVLMSPIEFGFQPDWIAFRWTEAARQALASSRGNAAPIESLRSGVKEAVQLQQGGFDDYTLRAMLHGKFLNPMLGIYGAHLMILKTDTDMTLLREVTENLQKLVGDHPDVLSLHLYLNDERAQQLSFPNPPMLRASWSLVVQNSTRQGVVPSGSYSAKIGANLWGSGAWLTWQVPQVEAQPAPTETERIDWVSLAKLAVAVSAPSVAGGLSPAERVVLSHVVSAASRVELAKTFASAVDSKKPFAMLYPLIRFFVSSEVEKQTKKDAAQSTTPDAITAATGIPYSTLTEAAISLLTKLQK
jgi:hypothetical protein